MPQLPLTIAPDQWLAMPIDVGFGASVGIGPFNGNLLIECDDPETPTATVSVHRQGAGARHDRARFPQLRRRRRRQSANTNRQRDERRHRPGLRSSTRVLSRGSPSRSLRLSPFRRWSHRDKRFRWSSGSGPSPIPTCIPTPFTCASRPDRGAARSRRRLDASGNAAAAEIPLGSSNVPHGTGRNALPLWGRSSVRPRRSAAWMSA